MAAKGIWERIAFLQGDLSLAEFCRQVGLSYQAIKKSNQRKTAPDTSALEKTARHYRADLNWLISGKSTTNRLNTKIAKRVKSLRVKLGWSVKDLSAKLSMHSSVFDKYEKGVWPLSTELLNDLLQIFNVDPYLLFQDEPPASMVPELKIFQANSAKGSPKIRNEDFISIPLTQSSIAAGQPIIQEDSIEDYVLLHIRAVGKKHNLVASRVDGDSMEPMLHSKDIVVINRDDKRIVPKGIYAVFYEEGLTAKFVEKQKNLLILRPINPTAQVQVINLSENQDPVVGRIIGAWKEF
ncbi:hypothetical protein UR09_03045 [Candidatus Nitromaritima sp. SCGC AAA799-A02]|nr:hypothetical protein UR09_03045 [Candidatus Nitromaritima sp. SCGC AAA799-A02]